METVTENCLNPEEHLVRCDTSKGKFMCVSLLYRGSASYKDVNQSVYKLRAAGKFRFVDWCPNGFKIGAHTQPMRSLPGSNLASVPASACGLLNTTAIKDLWRDLLRKYNLMYEKRAFVHWFHGEGMEKNEFECAGYDLEGLVKDYEELEMSPSSSSEGF